MDHATILAHLSAARRVRTRKQNIASRRQTGTRWSRLAGYFPTSRDFAADVSDWE
jgi:hypothetical protein